MDTEPILLRQNSDGTISNDLAEENAKAASKITVNNGNGKTATKKFGSVEDLQQSVALIAEYGNGSARLITLSELIQRGMITEQHARDITKQLSMTEIEINGRTYYVPSEQVGGLAGTFTYMNYGGIINNKDSNTKKENTHSKRISRTDYRKIFFEQNPELKGKVYVHHGIEQQVLNRPETKGLFSEDEIHSYENLRGIPIDDNSSLHLSEIRREWNRFYKENPDPTKRQLLQKRLEIDMKYGERFNPQIEN